jgi:hypothetical protein
MGLEKKFKLVRVSGDPYIGGDGLSILLFDFNALAEE